MYRIKSKKANKYITIKDNSTKGNNQCILYQKSPLMIQTFQYNIKDNHFVEFINSSTKHVITLSQGSDQNGAPFFFQPPTKDNENSQKFSIYYSEKENKEVTIFTYSGKCLDCCEEQTKNGTEIIQWDFHGSDNQKWILQKV